MTDPHACFRFGVLAGIALTFAITATVGWLFVLAAETDWTAVRGRVVAGWRRR